MSLSAPLSKMTRQSGRSASPLGERTSFRPRDMALCPPTPQSIGKCLSRGLYPKANPPRTRPRHRRGRLSTARVGLVAWDRFSFTLNRNHANDRIMIIRTSISPCHHRSRSRGAQRPARGFAGEAGVIGAAFVRLRCAALLAGETFPCCNPLKSPEMGLESRDARRLAPACRYPRRRLANVAVEAGGTRGQKSCRNPPETALIAGCAFNRRRRRTLAVAQIGRFGARGIFLDLLRCIIDTNATAIPCGRCAPAA